MLLLCKVAYESNRFEAFVERLAWKANGMRVTFAFYSLLVFARAS